MEEVIKDLQEVKNISVLLDSSNHTDLKKSVQVLIKYCIPGGVQVQLLGFINVPGEISALSSDHNLKVLDKFNSLDRIIVFTADNNNCNFGDAK
jgi:hypothetical protein